MDGVSALASAPAAADLYGISSAADVSRAPAEAARQLEALFLSMLLKEMRQALDPEGGLFPGDTGDIQGGLFDLYMGKHLADAGGVGLAAAVNAQLQRKTGTDGKDTPTGTH